MTTHEEELARGKRWVEAELGEEGLPWKDDDDRSGVAMIHNGKREVRWFSQDDLADAGNGDTGG